MEQLKPTRLNFQLCQQSEIRYQKSAKKSSSIKHYSICEREKTFLLTMEQKSFVLDTWGQCEGRAHPCTPEREQGISSIAPCRAGFESSPGRVQEAASICLADSETSPKLRIELCFLITYVLCRKSNNTVQGIHILCPDFGFKHSRTVNLVPFLLKLKDYKHGDMYKIWTSNCRDLILF